jgi:hypothetical protein
MEIDNLIYTDMGWIDNKNYDDLIDKENIFK